MRLRIGPMPSRPAGDWFVLGLGSNLPHSGRSGMALLCAALEALARRGFCPISRSSFWESAAWPDPAMPAYVNAVALAEAGGQPPLGVLQALLEIEADFGRQRGPSLHSNPHERWAARTLDLDLLDFGGEIMELEGLILPHPRMSQRNFVLAPLAQLAPWWRHPVSGRSAADLLRTALPGALRQLPEESGQAKMAD